MPTDTSTQQAVAVIRDGETYHGKQGLNYTAGISAETVGAKALCVVKTTIPPGGRATAHLHEDHETGIYVLSGESEVWWGPELDQHLVARAGDFVYIPAGVPHLPANRSQTEPMVAILARTDPNEQESVVLWPMPE